MTEQDDVMQRGKEAGRQYVEARERVIRTRHAYEHAQLEEQDAVAELYLADEAFKALVMGVLRARE